MPSYRRLCRRATSVIVLLCASAPHAAAGPWVAAGERRVVVRVGVRTESADERFCATGATACRPGARVPFDTTLGGSWRQDALSASADVGLSRAVSIGATLDVVRARYTDRVGERVASGLGDVTFRAHASFSERPVATGVDVRVKAPTARSPASAQSLRLSDGQWDVEAAASIGRSFWPVAAYAFVETGYRARTTSTRFTPAIDVGDEWTMHVETGWSFARRTSARVRAVGFLGGQDRAASVRTPGRSALRGEPSLAWSTPRAGEIELTASFALVGRGTAATRGVRLSYAAPPWAW